MSEIMRVKIIFVNEKGLIQKVIDKAEYSENEILYKTKKFPFSIFEKPSSLACDINKALYDLKKKEYVVFYENEKQLSLKDVEKLDIKDYLNNFKIAELMKELTLHKPSGIEELLPIIAILMMGVMLFIGYLSITQSIAQVKANFQVLNQTVKIMSENQKVLIDLVNSTKSLIKQIR
jgi:hypothetical protein